MKVFIAFLALASLAPSVLAQRPIGDASTRSGGSGGPSPFLPAFAVVEGIVLKVDTNRNAIQVRRKQDGKEIGYALDQKCKIKADKKDFEKKDLKLEELETGFEVELKIRLKDQQIIEMKVKRSKAKTHDGARVQ